MSKNPQFNPQKFVPPQINPNQVQQPNQGFYPNPFFNSPPLNPNYFVPPINPALIANPNQQAMPINPGMMVQPPMMNAYPQQPQFSPQMFCINPQMVQAPAQNFAPAPAPAHVPAPAPAKQARKVQQSSKPQQTGSANIPLEKSASAPFRPQKIEKSPKTVSTSSSQNSLLQKIETRKESSEGVGAEFWSQIEKIELSLKAQGELNIDMNEQKFKCRQCNQKFHTSAFLLKHIWECHRESM